MRTASEEPIDLSILKSLSTTRHYGWRWSGNEIDVVKMSDGTLVMCRCKKAPCGLVATQSFECSIHGHMRMGAAKQVHWSKDCPGDHGDG